MKRFFMLVLIAMLLIPMSAVFAKPEMETSAAPGTWVSSMNIQNVGTTAATIVLNFYDSTGALATTFNVTPALAAGASRSLYMPTDIPGLAAGSFSVVASSDSPLRVVVNLSSTAPYTADAYQGLDSSDTATQLYFPGLYNNYYGFNSELVLQNADTAAANVSIQFYNQATGAAVGSPYTDTIPASASKIFVLGSLSPALPSGNTNGQFSATITSTNAKNIGGISNVWTAYKFGEFGSYNGITTGSSTIYVPGLYNNYYNFVSALNVQNIGTASTDVTVTYSNGSTSTATLAPNQATSWFMPNLVGLPSGNTNGFFSAKVTASASGQIVATVNTEDKNSGLLSSYNAVPTATNSVGCPVVMQSYYKWFSSATVQNVGAAATNITATYSSGQTKTVNNVPANGSVNFIELSTAGTVLPNGSVVSAVFSSSGQPIVAVVNENSNELYALNAGDYLLSYTCFAK